jgi:hypothetical protein
MRASAPGSWATIEASRESVRAYPYLPPLDENSPEAMERLRGIVKDASLLNNLASA